MLYSSFIFTIPSTVGVAVYTVYLLGYWSLVGFALFFGGYCLQVGEGHQIETFVNYQLFLFRTTYA